MSEKAASLSDLLSVPKAGGALKGLGEKFSPDLQTGTGNFSLPIELPEGRNGLKPSLALAYSTGAGNGPFGLGWSLSVPGVSRLTAKGNPRYANGDVFLLSGAEDLVPVDSGEGWIKYRPRTEGLFARIAHHQTNGTDHWEVATKDGLVSIYGSPGMAPSASEEDSRAVIADPANRAHVFAWRLKETRDTFGNRVVYDYVRDTDGRDVVAGHAGEQLLLKRIRYVDLPAEGPERFFVSVECVYDAPISTSDGADVPRTVPEFPVQPRPDPYSDYRAGFEIRTRRRCKWVVVRTHPTADPADAIIVRAYELTYQDEMLSAADGQTAFTPSLLARIGLIGYTDQGEGVREMPPLDFGYTAFVPAMRRLTTLAGKDLPRTTLANPDIELADLFGRGLPDIVELNGAVPRYWRNLGGGRFDMPRGFEQAPAGLRLSDHGVQLLDADGDGRPDLLVTAEPFAGYYPLDFSGRFTPRSFQRYAQAPSFNLEDPEVRLLDLTGDGVSDVLRTGSAFECYFNDPIQGWTPNRIARIPRAGIDSFPNVSFSDPRVKLADLCGDGMQDIAVVYQGRIDYWPNLGYGRFGARLTMAIPEGLPQDFDPQRVIFGDVDGDGVADLLYVGDREVRLWLNSAGNRWNAPVCIRGTPAVNNMVSVRLVDLFGTGVPGLLWTRDASAGGQAQHFFLDFTGGQKPYLLNRMDNNLGAVTEVSYAASTESYLRDAARPATRWRTTLPFPVQVVQRLTVKDLLSQGSFTTEYRYHHGYWDGKEREFRGFGMVEQLDTRVFDAYPGHGAAAPAAALRALLAQETFTPPVLTRTWLHQGPVDPAERGPWAETDYSAEYWPEDADSGALRYLPEGSASPVAHREGIDAFLRSEAQKADRDAQRDALRTLRGKVLRTETFALDGSPLQDRPYTVTEQAYGIREVLRPQQALSRKRVFFPYQAAQRTTQWERGDDPMSQYSFVTDYDPLGQPQRELAVACPRGWRRWDDKPSDRFLATLKLTKRAEARPDGPYLCDRVIRTRAYEIDPPAEGGPARAAVSIADLLHADEEIAASSLIAETLTFYDGHAFEGEPYGVLGPYGMAVRTESLALTEAMLDKAFGAASPRPPYLDPAHPFEGGDPYPLDFVAALPEHAGYTYHAPSSEGGYAGGWYVQSARSKFDFQAGRSGAAAARGLLLAQRDPLGNDTQIALEDYRYQLLPERVTGPTGLDTRADFDLRTLRPHTVTDSNRNETHVRYSPSGLVLAVFVRGKHGADEGDKNEPGTRMEYAMRAFQDSRLRRPQGPYQPVYARAVRRVHHDTDPEDNGETIEVREYSDGFGRLLQTRTQGERVRFGDLRFGAGVLGPEQGEPGGGTVSGAENTDDLAPNVTVSGWQVYDDKGRVVKKYEPFFDVGWDYQPSLDARLGQCVQLFYDAPGRAARTLNPDGSEQRVVHGVPVRLDDPPLSPLETAKFRPTPWETYTYDQNDNAGRTHPGVELHQSYRQHHDTPTSSLVDALGRTVCNVARHRGPAAAGNLPLVEEHATRSSYDIQGNLTRIRDALGRQAFRYFHDLAKRVWFTQSLDDGRKWMVYDAAGNTLEARDDKGALRLQAHDELNRPKKLWARDAASESDITLRERLFYGDDDSLVRAEEARLNRLGRLKQHDDEAGRVSIHAYDFKGNVSDSRRQVLNDEFLLRAYRAELTKPDPQWNLEVPRIDWNDALAETNLGPAYVARSTFDALNRVKWSDYPKAGDEQRWRLMPRYNRAGVLESVALVQLLDDNGTEGRPQDFVQRIAYNAKGQRTLIAYGSGDGKGMLTRYAYDDATFRLTRMKTERWAPDGNSPPGYVFNGAPLQDMAYRYDLVGNMLGIQDMTPGSGVHDNPDALLHGGELALRLSAGDALLRAFEYDPLYRLTSATGRESGNIDAGGRPWSDDARNGYNGGDHGLPNQGNAPRLTRLYREQFSYDAAGNMLALHHASWAGRRQAAWTRRFGMGGFTPDGWLEVAGRLDADWEGQALPSNRLTHVEDPGTGVPSSALPTHEYDANGNMTRELGAKRFEWDHADRMKSFRNQTGNSQPTVYALYLYDAAGMRVKKLVVKGSGQYETTSYPGRAFEHHARGQVTANSTESKQNWSLHVVDGQARIAIKRLGDAFDDDGTAEHPVQFHLSDHLGSSSLILSAGAEWINREEYFPYGESSFGAFARKRYRFSGKERDEESGCYYCSARYLHPAIGRWLSVDPTAPNADGLNGYAYVSGRVLIAIDPTGEFAFVVLVGIAIVAVLLNPGVANAPGHGDRPISKTEGEVMAGTALSVAGGFIAGPLSNKVASTAIGKAVGPVASNVVGNGATGAGIGLTSQAAGDLSAGRLSPAEDYFKSGAFGAATMAPFGLLGKATPAGGSGGTTAASQPARPQVPPREPYIPRDNQSLPIPLKRAGPHARDNPLPDPDAKGSAHTTLGGKVSGETGELYRQSATFPELDPTVPSYAKPLYEVHWGNHGRGDHPNPHMHNWSKPDEAGKGWIRGETQPFPPWWNSANTP